MAKLGGWLLLFSLFIQNFAQKPPIVDLGYSTYQGVFDGDTNVTNFLGLRYAAAPVGELRWKAPKPPRNTEGIQQASSQPPQCPQANSGVSPTNPFPTTTSGKAKRQSSGTSEDCLFLNVHFPGETVPDKRLPVIVWIHGGGYVGGSASGFHGSDLIQQSDQGIVVVVIQYRLGLFGFLSGNEVRKNGSLNSGLLDQNFALRWVNQHISKFGGDPTRVTIWGESAGAGSVLQHIIAEDGQTKPQLFRGAVTSSSFLPSQYAFDDVIPQALYKEVVNQVNCTAVEDTLACLREVDTNALQGANADISSTAFFGTFTFVPVVDGTFIRQRPIDVMKQGKVNGEMLLSVTNTNEGNLFVNQTAPPFNASRYAAELFPKLGRQETAEVQQKYAGLGSTLTQENLIMGEAIFVCPTYYLLSAFQGRAFKGEFALLPAGHASDLAFYWPTLGAPITFNDTAFINAFAQSFVSFAISLDPNVKVDPTNITPHWDRYVVKNTEMVFNKTVEGLPDVHSVQTNGTLLERCRFWESAGALTGQ